MFSYRLKTPLAPLILIFCHVSKEIPQGFLEVFLASHTSDSLFVPPTEHMLKCNKLDLEKSRSVSHIWPQIIFLF